MAPTTKHTTSSRLIRATKLEASTFSAFGEVVQNPATTAHNGSPSHLQSVKANQGTATKWLDVTHMRNFYPLASSRRPAECVVNMFVCEPRELQRSGDGGKMVFAVDVLERHPFTPQMFVPVGVAAGDAGTRYLVIVAPTLPAKAAKDQLQPPPYPTEPSRRKRSLKERLLGARPNPYTNDHAPSTTPPIPDESKGPPRKGPGPPDLENIRAFIARGDQAVTYGPGTWHAPMVVLGDKPIDFVVVQYSNGVALEDCQEAAVGAEDGGVGLAVDVEGVVGFKARL